MRYLAPTFLAAVLVASAADGQPLYDWTAEAPQSVSSAATTGALTGPDLTASRPVAVDLDLLRSNPGTLAFPIPGTDETLWAVRTHFEDRGEGNVLWRGRVADGPLVNSITLTLEDGWLVGLIQEVGVQSFELTSSPDGVGRIAQPVWKQPVPHVHLDYEELVPHGHPSHHDAPVSVASASMDNADTDRSNAYTIDIMILWNRDVSKHPLWDGPPRTYVRSTVDWMNTVLSNNDLNLSFRLVYRSRMPASTERLIRTQHKGEWWKAIMDPAVAEIRFKHKADVVGWYVNGMDKSPRGRVECGAASRPWSQSGWASDMMNVATWSGAFANLRCYHASLEEGYRIMLHEISHLLGANHDRSGAFYNDHPLFDYSYGYRHSYGSYPRITGYYTIMTMPYQFQTAMPYFSSSIVRDTWTIGTAMEDNERTLLHTRATAVTFDSYLGIPDAAPSDLTVVERAGTVVDLSWTDNSSNEKGFEVFVREQGSEKWEAVAWPAADATTLTLGGERWDGTKYFSLGNEYKMWVVSIWGLAESPKSNVVSIGPLGRPVAPSGLTATPTPDESGSVDLSWTDNSDDETGFAVRYRRLGQSWNTLEGLAADTTTRTMSGLEPGRHYRFQVEASNQYGKRRSDFVTVKLPDRP